MGIRHKFTIESAVLAALWAGIGGFVVLHTALLLLSGNHQTRAVFRSIWFGGLAVVVLTSLYLVLDGRDADGLWK